jgi:hypothetical protein
MLLFFNMLLLHDHLLLLLLNAFHKKALFPSSTLVWAHMMLLMYEQYYSYCWNKIDPWKKPSPYSSPTNLSLLTPFFPKKIYKCFFKTKTSTINL